MTSEQTKEISSGKKIEDRVLRTKKVMPLALTVLFGTFWATTYLFLGRIHGMWPMFNSEFPFSTARLFTSQIDQLSPVMGALFAFIDGAVVGLAGSRIILLAGRITSNIGRKPRRWLSE